MKCQTRSVPCPLSPPLCAAAAFEELGTAYALIGTAEAKAAHDNAELRARGYYFQHLALVSELQAGQKALADTLASTDHDDGASDGTEPASSRRPRPAPRPTLWFTQYYSTHCGACKDARAYFVAFASLLAASELGAHVRCAAVECGRHGVLCSRAKVMYSTCTATLPACSAAAKV
jgi:hypothetical protein